MKQKKKRTMITYNLNATTGSMVVVLGGLLSMEHQSPHTQGE